MPTFETTTCFSHDLDRLTPAQRARFHRVVRTAFVPDLRAGRCRTWLRVKKVQCARHGVYELTWAPDGRATWEYGTSVRPGQPHIVWRRIGTHDILTGP
ncbi:hypothetical protein ACIP88_00070 [Streptomyces uncialis]|uniref:hypothetical protein n=1 Tax=Streptomyces uncialis TaxID=1048205 RepID=UPI00382C037A